MCIYVLNIIVLAKPQNMIFHLKKAYRSIKNNLEREKRREKGGKK